MPTPNNYYEYNTSFDNMFGVHSVFSFLEPGTLSLPRAQPCVPSQVSWFCFFCCRFPNFVHHLFIFPSFSSPYIHNTQSANEPEGHRRIVRRSHQDGPGRNLPPWPHSIGCYNHWLFSPTWPSVLNKARVGLALCHVAPTAQCSPAMPHSKKALMNTLPSTYTPTSVPNFPSRGDFSVFSSMRRPSMKARMSTTPG